MDEKFETFFFKNLRLPFQKWLGQRIFKLQNSKFFSWNKFFWIINLDIKLVFIIQYCKHYSWIVPFCYILWREKLKKEILKKFPIVKKIIKTPPKTFSPLLLHNFSYILPTWLPDTPIDFPPWRNISKKNFLQEIWKNFLL